MENPMNMNVIVPHLYQGTLPAPVDDLRAARIQTVVLCAAEEQPSDSQLSGFEVIRCPFLDNGELPEIAILAQISSTADLVATRALAFRSTLVTCAQGRNRSGLVVALALLRILRCSGEQAVAYVRRMRPQALTNESFVSYLALAPATSPLWDVRA